MTRAAVAVAPVAVSQKALGKSSGLVLQRKCACGGAAGLSGQCEECGEKRLSLQHRVAGPATGLAPPIVHEVLGSPGQPLDPATRAYMEPRFGHDFSRVRVHADARAAKSADTVSALAYTVGQNVVFASGQYAPATTSGGMLLAHELTHVMQQQHGRVSGLQAIGPTLALDERLEHEAHELGARVSLGEFIDSGRMPAGMVGAMSHVPGRSSLRLQRKEAPPKEPIRYATRRAYPFVPDHPFYEILAHVFSYRDDLDGKFLYRAYQSLRRETTPVDPSPVGKSAPSITGFQPPPAFEMPGVSAGIPASLGDNFAIMSTEPETPPPIPYMGGEEPPLIYKVHLMRGSDLANAASGLVAYYLIPWKGVGPRIVAFRGTDPKAADIAADADKKGVGWSVFDQHRDDIKSMLDAEKNRGNGLVVVGHSLGGALAQWTATEFADVTETVTFNSPGISKDAAAKFAARKNKPKVSHYVTRGDIVSTAGQALLPGNVTMLEGNATHGLEEMLESGEIKLAENALMYLLAVVSTFAKADLSFERRVGLAASVWLKLKTSGGLAALERMGGFIVALHSQGLLRVNQLQSAPVNQQPWPNIDDPRNKKWKPLAADIEARWDDVGQVTANKKKPAEINVASVEAARVHLSGAIGDIYGIFSFIMPLISALEKNISATIGLEQQSKVGPVEIIAKQLEPLVSKLLVAIMIVGGLSKLIEKALYYQPKPTRDYKTPLAAPDATMTKYHR
jgi:pimeloyl-ACP methyl ester carboxylesterase